MRKGKKEKFVFASDGFFLRFFFTMFIALDSGDVVKFLQMLLPGIYISLSAILYAKDKRNELEKLLTFRGAGKSSSLHRFRLSCIFIYAFSKKLSDNLLISTPAQAIEDRTHSTFTLPAFIFRGSSHFNIIRYSWLIRLFNNNITPMIVQQIFYSSRKKNRVERFLASITIKRPISTYNHRRRSLYNFDI